MTLDYERLNQKVLGLFSVPHDMRNIRKPGPCRDNHHFLILTPITRVVLQLREELPLNELISVMFPRPHEHPTGIDSYQQLSRQGPPSPVGSNRLTYVGSAATLTSVVDQAPYISQFNFSLACSSVFGNGGRQSGTG